MHSDLVGFEILTLLFLIHIHHLAIPISPLRTRLIMSMIKRLARTLKLGKEKFYVGADLQGIHPRFLPVYLARHHCRSRLLQLMGSGHQLATWLRANVGSNVCRQ